MARRAAGPRRATSAPRSKLELRRIAGPTFLLLALAMGAPALAGAAGAAGAEAALNPVAAPVKPQFAAQAFGTTFEIAVAGVEPKVAEEAFAKSVLELAALEKLTNPANPEGDLGRLNETAHTAPQAVDPRVLRLLERAQGFCYWSEGAHGALGADLYALWGLRRAPGGLSSGETAVAPTGELLTKAVAAAACANATVDADRGTLALGPGARVEPWGFLEGLGVDRVAEILLGSGCKSFLVRIGSVWRAAGAGADGRGWTVELPRLAGTSESAGRVVLKDRSLALAAPPLGRAAGAGFAGYLNQRTGRPPEGVVAAAAITEFAIDAEGLAITLFVVGPREGQLRAGSLIPKPSASWWMGSGEGAPLQVHYRWSEGQLP